MELAGALPTIYQRTLVYFRKNRPRNTISPNQSDTLRLTLIDILLHYDLSLKVTSHLTPQDVGRLSITCKNTTTNNYKLMLLDKILDNFQLKEQSQHIVNDMLAGMDAEEAFSGQLIFKILTLIKMYSNLKIDTNGIKLNDSTRIKLEELFTKLSNLDQKELETAQAATTWTSKMWNKLKLADKNKQLKTNIYPYFILALMKRIPSDQFKLEQCKRCVETIKYLYIFLRQLNQINPYDKSELNRLGDTFLKAKLSSDLDLSHLLRELSNVYLYATWNIFSYLALPYMPNQRITAYKL